MIELPRDLARELALLVHRLLQEDPGDVLDLRPRRDARHCANAVEVVEENLRSARLRIRIEERIRARDGLEGGANSTKRQAASLFSAPRGMQYASEWRIDAGSSNFGSGATSQSNAVIVRKPGVARRESKYIAVRPLRKRASLSSDSSSSSLGMAR